MTTYNVHVYREMRLVFSGIEAASPEEAAALARDKPTENADEVDDECDSETFYALVDVQGDEQHEQSRFIDFEPERLRLAAPKLLEACRMVIGRWEDGDLGEAARTCAAAIVEAEAASARRRSRPPHAQTAGITPTSREAASKRYSVLLLYPDWANDSGTETYYVFVEAPNPNAAVAEAQRQAVTTNEWTDDVHPTDFAPLLVTEGRNSATPWRP